MSPWAIPKSVITRFNRKKKIWMSCAFANASTSMPGRLVMATPANTYRKPNGHFDQSADLCWEAHLNWTLFDCIYRTAHLGRCLFSSLYTRGLNADSKGSCHMGHKLHRNAHSLQSCGDEFTGTVYYITKTEHHVTSQRYVATCATRCFLIGRWQKQKLHHSM